MCRRDWGHLDVSCFGRRIGGSEFVGQEVDEGLIGDHCESCESLSIGAHSS